MTPWNKKGGGVYSREGLLTTPATVDCRRVGAKLAQVALQRWPEAKPLRHVHRCLHRRASNTASKTSLSLPGAQNLSNLRFPKTLRTRKKWVQEDFRHFNVKILRRAHLVPSGMSSGRRCGAKSRPTGRKLTPRCGIFGLLWVFWSRQGCPQR